MDAKAKANFINSVSSGNTMPCPVCGNVNENDCKFCASCGFNFENAGLEEISATAERASVQKNMKANKYEEPEYVFAQGLPDWSVEPPQVMVRRHKI